MDPEDPDSDPNHSLNLITSSFYHFGHILKILSKFVHKFLSYLVHKQTNRWTDKPRRKHNLLGGSNKSAYTHIKYNCTKIAQSERLQNKHKFKNKALHRNLLQPVYQRSFALS